jgi:hypothetical protein
MSELLNKSEASATLVTLLGAGVGGLVIRHANLFHAARRSPINIREEASLICARLAPLKKTVESKGER